MNTGLAINLGWLWKVTTSSEKVWIFKMPFDYKQPMSDGANVDPPYWRACLSNIYFINSLLSISGELNHISFVPKITCSLTTDQNKSNPMGRVRRVREKESLVVEVPPDLLQPAQKVGARLLSFLSSLHPVLLFNSPPSHYFNWEVGDSHRHQGWCVYFFLVHVWGMGKIWILHIYGVPWCILY